MVATNRRTPPNLSLRRSVAPSLRRFLKRSGPRRPTLDACGPVYFQTGGSGNAGKGRIWLGLVPASWPFPPTVYSQVPGGFDTIAKKGSDAAQLRRNASGLPIRSLYPTSLRRFSPTDTPSDRESRRTESRLVRTSYPGSPQSRSVRHCHWRSDLSVPR